MLRSRALAGTMAPGRVSVLHVLGIDGTASGWVVVELVDGRFTQARAVETIREAIDAFPEPSLSRSTFPSACPGRGAGDSLAKLEPQKGGMS